MSSISINLLAGQLPSMSFNLKKQQNSLKQARKRRERERNKGKYKGKKKEPQFLTSADPANASLAATAPSATLGLSTEIPAAGIDAFHGHGAQIRSLSLR
ncbi:hypothetical protein TRV_06587 [Trichophyton verrucosum HKI 0517]|uniref:Uncharacterized protein n=1 Tax=Trichophyton verrucosum (strain HKI 0517) TaxID=663202 RepID=D4DHD1_TRIVH|nr:uncharacterized protein TRV_06587 [Trichophyton verrucosum HKI 0517]EFE38739.1 hypothetical protein TRV_06587 [Trichophyton verrucosum HKI 0517]